MRTYMNARHVPKKNLAARALTGKTYTIADDPIELSHRVNVLAGGHIFERLCQILFSLTRQLAAKH